MLEFDYVVVGAGSAGCALASRLSEVSSNRVALVEAGGRDIYPWIHVPVGYFKTMGHGSYDWNYRTESDLGLGGRSLSWPRGRVLGGSSSINGLLYVRGQREDFEHWRDLGNIGWGWSDMLPLFKRSESWQGSESQYRGSYGGLYTETSRVRHVLVDSWIDSAESLGYRRCADYNGEEQEGSGYFQMTMRGGFRCSSARAYLSAAKKRVNLKIFTDTQALGVVFEDKRAVGVKTRRRGEIAIIKASAEVILCAGAIGSPQLLMLSGIGAGDDLRELGIDVVSDSFQVGKNMQDHLQARPVYKCTPSTTNTETANLWSKFKIACEYAVSRTGTMAMAASLGVAFFRTKYSPDRPDIQFHIQPFSKEPDGKDLHRFSAFTASVLQLRPESRGEIKLRSANPDEHPLLYPNYLSKQHDCDVLVEGLRISHRIAQQEPLKSLITGVHAPDNFSEDYDVLLDFARHNSTTIYHPTGTCIMGSSSEHVVDSQLRVRGVECLRVADASIMPEITSGNTNAPAIVIGEKASDLIRGI